MLGLWASANKIFQKKYFIAVALLALLLLALLSINKGYSDTLGSRSIQMSSNQASAVAEYKISFSTITPDNVGSIKIQFCANDPLVFNPCVAPGGFDASSTSLVSQSGLTGFGISNSSTANEIILTRTPAMATPTAVQYVFSNIINPNSAGSLYARILTYDNSNASGNYTDYGGLALAILNPFTVEATVPPYLTFCNGVTIGNIDCANTQGDFLDLGELSPLSAKSGTSQMLVTTNAELGYNITVQGITMTSGINAIPALAISDISRPGTSQFGLNLRANNSPQIGNDPQGPGIAQPSANYNQPNLYRFVDGEQIVNSNGPDEPRLFTVSYIVNITPSQPAGVYASTITYICLGDF